MVEVMEKDRELRNSFGRLMRIYGFKWNKWEKRWFTTEREEGLAFHPQTDAAEMMKGILPAEEEIARAYGGDLLMTVHDEVVTDIPRDKVTEYIAASVPNMERDWPQLGKIAGFGYFACPVDVAVGWNWAKVHKHHRADCDVGCILNERGKEEWNNVPHRKLTFA